MRILVVSNPYPPVVVGGYEVECAAVVDRLRRDGHAVTVLTGRPDRPVAPQPGVRRVFPLLAHDWRGTVRAPSASLHAARTMRRALTELRPDLVYVWNGSRLPMAILAVALDSPHPVAFRVCERWFGRLFAGVDGDQFLRHLAPGQVGRRRVLDPVARVVNRHPALRIDPLRRRPAAVCWNAEALRAHTGMPAVIEPVVERTVHSVAVRGPAFAAAARRPAAGPPVLAYVGRVDAAKGADVAVRALARIRRAPQLRDCRLRMAGPAAPAFRSRLDALARRAGLPSHAVELLGPRPVEQVVELLSTAHVQLVPSRWFEPFPQVCLEGALARIPVVAAASGGIPECLRDEEHALLFPTGDADACAAAVVRTLTEPHATDARVARAFARASTEFDLDTYLDATAAFVDDAVTALRRRRGQPD